MPSANGHRTQQRQSSPQKSKGQSPRDCKQHEFFGPCSVPVRNECLQQTEFAPSPNRFSILAELHQSQRQTTWGFDVVPTSHDYPRRRGGRNEKKLRTRPTAVKAGQPGEAEGGGPAAFNNPNAPVGQSTSSESNPWLPQSWSNPLPPVSSAIPSSLDAEAKKLLEPVEHCPKVSDVPEILTPITDSKLEDARSLLQPFLFAPTASTTGAGNHDSKYRGLSPALNEPASEKEFSSASFSSDAQRAAASAACRALASQPKSTQGAQKFPSVQPSNFLTSSTSPAIYLGAPTTQLHTVREEPPSSVSPALPALTALGATSTSKSKHHFLAYSKSIVPEPPIESASSYVAPVQSPQLLSSSRLAKAETRAGTSDITTPKLPSPVELITAPITSPHPFVPPQCLNAAPKSTSQFRRPDFNMHTASHPPDPAVKNTPILTPEERKGLYDFLTMGHAKDCWCGLFHKDGTTKYPLSRAKTEVRQLSSSNTVACSDHKDSQASSDEKSSEVDDEDEFFHIPANSQLHDLVVAPTVPPNHKDERAATLMPSQHTADQSAPQGLPDLNEWDFVSSPSYSPNTRPAKACICNKHAGVCSNSTDKDVEWPKPIASSSAQRTETKRRDSSLTFGTDKSWDILRNEQSS